MPIIKSAIERMRTNEKAHQRNISQKNQMRTAVKKFHKLESAKSSEELQNIYRNAVAAVDHAKSKGLIKKNTASRRKSQLAKKYAELNK